MSASTRWTLFVMLLTVNVVYQLVYPNTWHQIAVSSLTGLGLIGLLIEYLARGRRER
ncbi:hypothetical protein [Actinomadura oligospora]|uniref:hypothetical protein n=1 Tax=Actinomadura oligospora TaxID=111804 RepID=UPI0004B14562|nr:hypothetical protein [Actinomadura oligospora]